MKKIAVCLHAAAFMFSVSGCGDNNGSSTAGQDTGYQQNGAADNAEQENVGLEPNGNDEYQLVNIDG